MLGLLAFVLAAVAVIVALQFLADRTALPAAALLTVAGLVWLGLTQTVPRALRARRGKPAAGGAQYLSGRGIAVLSWSGTRGVISLAAIFTLPLVTSRGQAFPGRDLLLFCTYLVVVVTLVGQGLTFAWLTKAMGVRADPADAALVRTEARAAAVQAGRSRLDQIPASWDVPGPALAALRAHLDQQARRYRQWLDRLEAGEDAHPSSSPGELAAQQARRAVIDAQREELLRWRDAGHLPDASPRPAPPGHGRPGRLPCRTQRASGRGGTTRCPGRRRAVVAVQHEIHHQPLAGPGRSTKRGV